MRITIHRGAREVGGSCIEVAAGGKRLILDLGLPLVDEKGQPFEFESRGRDAGELVAAGILPGIGGCYQGEAPQENLLGLIVTHAHQDHYGLSGYLSDQFPVYASKGTAELMEVSRMFLPRIKTSGKINLLSRLPGDSIRYRPVSIGPFTVQAYAVDHAAPDAIAVLVEAEGKRLFYSGDFRSGGRTSYRYTELLADPPRHIDALLMEGTTIGRKTAKYPREEDVELEMTRLLKRADDLVLLFCSSQNLDRLVTACKAARNSGRTFVIDLYTAFILERLKILSKNIPQYHWEQMAVFYLKHHADILVRNGFKEFLFRIKGKGRKIEAEEIQSAPERYLVLARRGYCLKRCIGWARSPSSLLVIWSLWKGYLERDEGTRKLLSDKGIKPIHVHTSGHASPDDLEKLVAAVNPGKLVPVHTFDPEAVARMHPCSVPAEDGVPVCI